MQLGPLHDLPNAVARVSCRSDDLPWQQEAVGPDSGAAAAAKRRSEVVKWLNALFPGLGMAHETSDDELRVRLLDGALLCGILKRFSPSHAGEIISAANRSENVRKFIAAVEQAGLPSFSASELEQGSMPAVVYCLWSLKEHLASDIGEVRDMSSPLRSVGRPILRWRSMESRIEALRSDKVPNVQSSAVFGEERRSISQDARLQRILRSPVMSEPSTPAVYQSGPKFHEVFQLKHGRYYDIPAAKITEMMKSNSLDNAPTQSLLSVMNGILDESIERKNGEIPHRVACLLRKVMQEIERRISTQAEHIRNQNNLIKTREEKYQSRIRVLETLANGATDEIPQAGVNQVQLRETERLSLEKRSRNHEEYMAKLGKEKEKSEQIISELKKELEALKRTGGQCHQLGIKKKEDIKSEQTISELQQEIETLRRTYEEQLDQMKNRTKEKDQSGQTISELQQEIETIKRSSEEQRHERENKTKENDQSVQTISEFQQEIEIIKKTYEEQRHQQEKVSKEEKSELKFSELHHEIETIKRPYEQQFHQTGGGNAQEKEKSELLAISKFKQEIETIKKAYEEQCRQMEDNAKEKVKSEQTISELKREIEIMKRTYGEQFHQTGDKTKDTEKSELIIAKLNQEIETIKKTYEEQCRQMEENLKEKEMSEKTILKLKQEIESIKKTYGEQCLQMGDNVTEKEESEQTTLRLNQERETIKKTYEEQCHLMEKEKEESKRTILELKQEIESIKRAYEEQSHQLRNEIKEKEKSEQAISELSHEIETIKEINDNKCQKMESKAKESLMEIEKKLKDTEFLLAVSERKINELETISEFKFQIWNKKERIFHSYMDQQVESVQELRLSSDSIKQEVKTTETRWCEEVSSIGKKFKVLTDAVENYHSVLAENRKLYNDLQELRGNIRVYCRVRPFLPGENQKETVVESIGENGEIGIVNPAKQGKEPPRSFKFNKVFGQTATQEEVYLDTRPLVRSVLDGYNVCIFAYGQTGSGKTYTMTGPDIATEKEWGVNYRALNDLFNISRQRSDIYVYEVGVQMVEVYNEQIRDLLASGSSQKKLGVLANAQATGLAVPDASMLPVTSTSDVMDLMQAGHHNRSVSATTLNERSSRSHSIVTIHVRGTDTKNQSTLRGSLHLVDLAGSERVDRSEVTGDRLKEAQHINKSLAALGDVIFALAQKSTHVPYRNSKLTQVLQSSLGGHAKTLMFVQINPEIGSFTESLSTLKFAERVSGVELGAAKSLKEGKDIKDLMEQVASLKDTIARKDDEIEQLQQIKGAGSSSLRRSSSGETPREFGSENDGDQNSADPEGSGDENSEERSSVISDDVQSIGTEDDSAGVPLENSNDTEQKAKSSETRKEKVRTKVPSRVSKSMAQKTVQSPPTRTRSRELLKPSTTAAGPRKSTSQPAASSGKPPSRVAGKAPAK